MKKILILFGGNSYEHLVSCKSAKTIMENIDKKKYDVTLVGITKSNTWYIYNDLLKYLDNELWYTKNVIKIDNIISFLKTFDKVFPIIHGNPLENGNLQGLLNMFNIKYVGSNLEESSICYDKEITKIILNNYNINQVPYKVILNKKDDLKLNFDFPVIVKPSRCGSSIGINIAYNNKELKKYIKEAFKYDNKVIVEKYIKDNLELECSILENKKLLVSTVGMIKPINKFYDYEAKYEKTTNLIIPALINKELEKEIKMLSFKIFKILNLKNLARIDFLYDNSANKLYFNEVNTMPGFTNISMFPSLFNYDNINIKELISILIEN